MVFMKKYLFISLLAVLSLCFTSCEENTPQLRKKTIDLEVNETQWKYTASTHAYVAHFEVPQITWNIYHYGEISVSHEYYHDSIAAYQVPLPESSYLADTLSSGAIAFYTQHISYSAKAGAIDVSYIVSDYYYPEGFNPGKMYFRLQLTY